MTNKKQSRMIFDISKYFNYLQHSSFYIISLSQNYNNHPIVMFTANTIHWRNLRLVHNKTNKQILSNLNGCVNNGEFLTIMGQSGAGKSSFVSILTARTTSRTTGFSLQGNVFMNGQEYGISKFGKCAAYVRQDDIIMGTLTVEETFQFQAELKLHYLQKSQQELKSNQIIKRLNLQQCKKSLIGSKFAKCISGGQRKRVAIGVQLLANPSCLILDQPTSGLDSSNSLKIMKILKKLADDGRIIIATIHQPSTLMFHQMDKLMLLGKGKTLYFGLAKQIVTYMENIGVKVDHRMNPTDFFMLQISQFKNSKGYNTPMTPQNFLQYSQNKKQLPYQDTLKNQQIKIIPQTKPQASKRKQFPILFKRSLKNYFRTKSNLYGKILVLIIIPVFMCLLYHDIIDQYPIDQTNLQQMIQYFIKVGAFIFMLTFFNFGMNIYDTVLSYPPEKQLVLKETSARLYSLSNYYICRCLIQIPISISICIGSTTIVYFVVGLQSDIDYFLRFVLIIILVAICGYMLGTFVGIIFSTAQHAIQILPLIVIPLVMFGGLIVNLYDIPVYARWFQYLSPIRHTYSSLMADQLETQKMHKIIIRNKDFIEKIAGIHGTFSTNTWMLLGIAIASSIGSLIALYIKRKPI